MSQSPSPILNKQQIKSILSQPHLNPYILFSTSQRSTLKASNPSFSLPEITRMISSEWSKMSDTAKQPYITQSQSLQSSYHSLLSRIPSPVRSKLLKKKASKVKIDWAGEKDFQPDGGDISDSGLVSEPKKPKLPASVYKLFCATAREKLKESGFSAEEKRKEIAKEWKTIEPEEKLRFKALAEDDKKRYERDVDEYLKEIYLFKQMEIQSKRKKSHSGNKIQVGKNGVRVDPELLQVPKRPMSPYMIYAKEERQVIQTKMAHCTYDEILRAISIKWAKMPKEEKKPYEVKAMNERRRYQLQMEAFRDAGGKLPIEKKVENEAKENCKEETKAELKFHGHGTDFNFDNPFEDFGSDEKDESSNNQKNSCDEDDGDLDLLVAGI